MATELIMILLLSRVDIKSGQQNLPKEDAFCTLLEVFIIERVLVLWFLFLWNKHEVSIKIDSCYKRSVEGNKINQSINESLLMQEILFDNKRLILSNSRW